MPKFQHSQIGVVLRVGGGFLKMPEKISRHLYLGFNKKKNQNLKINNKQGNDEIMLNTLIIKGG